MTPATQTPADRGASPVSRGQRRYSLSGPDQDERRRSALPVGPDRELPGQRAAMQLQVSGYLCPRDAAMTRAGVELTKG